ncbi:MAG: hypothetical protein AB7F43_13295 [Bacteriovoracia bacterium]
MKSSVVLFFFSIILFAGFAVRLPNVVDHENIQVASDSYLELKFDRGWKLNNNAPSYLEVVEEISGGVLSKLSKTDLQKKAKLSLDTTKRYFLRGTIYFCDAAKTQCIRQSIDKPLEVSEGGPSNIVLHFKK